MRGAWEWWAGYGPEVDDENIYTIACCSTRDEVIEAGKKVMPDPDGHTCFYIIEARASGQPDQLDEISPFGETRNKEMIDVSGEVI